MSRKFTTLQPGLGLFDWEPSGPAPTPNLEIAPPIREPETCVSGAVRGAAVETGPRPAFLMVAETHTNADEIAAIRKRRDAAQECLAIARKSTGGEKLADSYLSELGQLQRRLWDLWVRWLE